MIDIVQFQTRDGSVVSVEVEEEETLGVERVARGERMIAQNLTQKALLRLGVE